MVLTKKNGGKWSLKYKRSINCKHPKGFSQRQHCKYGRTKKNKKQFGGNGIGYTLVGFSGLPLDYNMNPNRRIQNKFYSESSGRNRRVPIFLPNRENFELLYTEIGGSIVSNTPMYVILPELYKLEWVHGKINLYDMLRSGVLLCDENEKCYFKTHYLTHGPFYNEANLPPGYNPKVDNDNINQNKFLNWLNKPDTYNPETKKFTGKTRKDVIIEIETKYPGLFIPMFVNDPTRYHYAYDDTYVNAI